MAGKKTSDTVWALAAPVAEALGLVLWDVAFEKEGASWFLRIFLDKPGGVDLDDCERFSRRMDPILDAADPIKQSYYLEVSSAGLGRKLKKPHQFMAVLGQEILIKLYRPRDGKKEFTGVLKAFDAAEKCFTLASASGADETFAVADCSLIKCNDDADLF